MLKSALLPHIDTQSPDLSAYSPIKHITCPYVPVLLYLLREMLNVGESGECTSVVSHN